MGAEASSSGKLPEIREEQVPLGSKQTEIDETEGTLEGKNAKRGLGKWASDSQLSAAVPTNVSAAAPSYLSSAMFSELSRTYSFPGVAKDIVRRVHTQDDRVAKCMVEYKRYLSYGDRGNKHFFPLGETDATAYANAFTKATSGVPPHKWDPRGSAAPPPDK